MTAPGPAHHGNTIMGKPKAKPIEEAVDKTTENTLIYAIRIRGAIEVIWAPPSALLVDALASKIVNRVWTF